MSIEDKEIILNTEETAIEKENDGEKKKDVESCVTQLETSVPEITTDINKDEPFCDKNPKSLCNIIPEGKQNGEIQMKLILYLLGKQTSNVHKLSYSSMKNVYLGTQVHKMETWEKGGKLKGRKMMKVF